MKRAFFVIPFVLALAALFVSACSLIPTAPAGSPNAAATQRVVIEEAVRATATTMALQTEVAGLKAQLTKQPATNKTAVLPAETKRADTAVPPTNTAEPPTATNTPTNTAVPPTKTPIPPTATLRPTITITPIPCNAAQFVSDVTIPDGTVFEPGVTFTKTWRLKNVGACTWTTKYAIAFTGGSRMGSPSALNLEGNVSPGQVIDVSVDFTAPANVGHYASNWKLRDAGGVLFGLGRTDAAFFVDINVEDDNTSGLPLDFIGRMCSAEWTSGAGKLPCPGAKNSASGFVLRIDKPTLESGYVDDEPALLTYPQMINDGVIHGKYPAIRVKDGYRFVSAIGCQNKAKSCDVVLRLDYQIGSGAVKTLKSWHEVYDEKFAQVSVDLSSLAGKDIKFILTAYANGASTQDGALWLLPRIEK